MIGPASLSRRRALATALLGTLLLDSCAEPLEPRLQATQLLESQWTAPATAPVGSPLAEPLRVRVIDADSRPVAGHRVAFTVTRGLGVIQVADTVTGPDGIASAGTWTLGPTAGAQEVVAHLPQETEDQRVVFRVVAAPAAPARIVLTSGTFALSAGDSSDLAVVVRDQFGNSTTAPSGLTFTSSDTTVLRVSTTGRVRAIARGTSRVTVTSGALSAATWLGVRSGTPTVIAEEVSGPAGEVIAIDDSRTAYVAASGSNAVTRFDLATRTATGTVALSAGVLDVAFLTAGSVAYVSTTDSLVHVIDAAANVLLRSFRVPAPATRLLPSPDGAWVFASTNSAVGLLLRISTSNDADVAVANVSGTARSMALSADGTRIFVTSSASQLFEVSADPFTRLRSVIISNATRGLDVTSAGDRLLVTHQSDSLDVRLASDLTRLVVTSSGASMAEVADTPSGDYVIMSNPFAGIRVHDGYSLEPYLTRSAHSPGRIAFDTATGEVWIASASGILLRMVLQLPP